MLITMIKDQTGADDGFTVKLYKKGQEYDLNEGLANAFIDMGVATEQGEKTDEKTEVKKVDTPENKKAETPENKSADKKDKKEKGE